MSANPKALCLAAPASGSGKTTVTLALLRALRNQGHDIRAAKAGPDYIDPVFHERASAKPCPNLDIWAMRRQTLQKIIKDFAAGSDGLLIEGVMGLYDGPKRGSTADLAKALGVPVILIVDVAAQAQSVAALIKGFVAHDPDLVIAGIIANRVASTRHQAMIRDAIEPTGVPFLGAIPRDERLKLERRHLGLVQAREHPELEKFLEESAKIISQSIDLNMLIKMMKPIKLTSSGVGSGPLPPLGQHIAIARDDAFGFCYPHMLQGWRTAGAEVSFFSPLADEAPDRGADAVFLPGGYPELHAGKIAANENFIAAMKKAASNDTLIYGECGGYMVLGEGIIGQDGTRHAMLGLLELETSFADPVRHLGYRQLNPLNKDLFNNPLKAHEFHFTKTVKEQGQNLFQTSDATGTDLGPAGLIKGRVMGSYMHIIDQLA